MARLRATNCVDMLCSAEERRGIAGGQRVHWLTPGWLKYWKRIFREWDAGKANEMFPQHDKAVLLDALGMYEEVLARCPEEILEFSDWMKLPIEPHAISLDRLKGLLAERLQAFAGPEQDGSTAPSGGVAGGAGGTAV